MENLNVKVGCDIIEIKRFKNMSINSLQKIFYKDEINKSKPETIAGIFAAKESCRKVFNNLKWHDIKITKLESGKPTLHINKKSFKDIEIISSDISISHDGQYAIAFVIFLIKI